jgi:hypothetical protein
MLSPTSALDSELLHILESGLFTSSSTWTMDIHNSSLFKKPKVLFSASS